MAWIDAMLPALERQKQAVLSETWGHLAPSRNRTYRGFIVFAIGWYGDGPLNPMILESEFKGLDSSPWFYEAINEYVSSLQHSNHKSCFGPATYDLPPGSVYRFDGTFRNYKFKGAIKQILAPQTQEKQ